jgi:hypothetical protein
MMALPMQKASTMHTITSSRSQSASGFFKGFLTQKLANQRQLEAGGNCFPRPPSPPRRSLMFPSLEPLGSLIYYCPQSSRQGSTRRTLRAGSHQYGRQGHGEDLVRNPVDVAQPTESFLGAYQEAMGTLQTEDRADNHSSNSVAKKPKKLEDLFHETLKDLFR